MSTDDTTPQRPLRNPLRARFARLAQLGLLRSYTTSPDSALVTIHTTAGDAWTGPYPRVTTYLDGVAQGAWAQKGLAEHVATTAAASVARAQEVHQPREHPVPCLGCHRPTSAVHAYCGDCMARSEQMLLVGTCERCRVKS